MAAIEEMDLKAKGLLGPIPTLHSELRRLGLEPDSYTSLIAHGFSSIDDQLLVQKPVFLMKRPKTEYTDYLLI